MQIENRIVISADDKVSGTLKKIKGTLVDLNKEAVEFAKQQSSIEKAVQHDVGLVAQAKSQQSMARSTGNSRDINKDREVYKTDFDFSKAYRHAKELGLFGLATGLSVNPKLGLPAGLLGAGGGFLIGLGEEYLRVLEEEAREEKARLAALAAQKAARKAALDARRAEVMAKDYATTRSDNLGVVLQPDQVVMGYLEKQGYKAGYEEVLERAKAANQAARELADGDHAVQAAKQATRDIAVVTEQARAGLIETREVGLGVYDEWITAQAKWIEEQDKAVREAVEAGNDFANGWRAGLNEYVRDAGNVFRQAELLAQTTAQSMRHSFSDFFFDAMRGQIKGFEDYLNSFVVSVQRAVADMAAQRMTASLISGIGGLLSAHGNVFENGQVLPFASGGVVSSPTLFPLGLMGEAGPEAILPLQRTRSGDLGVKAEGSGGGDVVNVNFTVVANDSRSFKDSMVQNRAVILGVVQDAYNRRGQRGPLA